MTGNELREKFLRFFEEKGHMRVPSSSLIPDDPSVLLTTAGMQQFKPYYSELDPETTIHPSIGKPVGKNAVSVQKSFRTSDIDEVGDESHLTFFEMLGNFSFGGYFKEDAIRYAHEFITKTLGLPISYVTIFDPKEVPDGDWRKEGVLFDEDSHRIWKELGVSEDKILRQGVDVFWGPTGNEGPCGPTTEIYVRSAQGKDVEIWNIVFNEFYCHPSRKLAKLEKPGIDTGMGLERLAMVVQNKSTIFETDLFGPIVEGLPDSMEMQQKRIFADHVRGVCFLISDGVRPSNKEAGYVLRRLIRRLIVQEFLVTKERLLEQGGGTLLVPTRFIDAAIVKVVAGYSAFYTELDVESIEKVFREETIRFSATLKAGILEVEKADTIDVKLAFRLYESFGLPYEALRALAGAKAADLRREDFDKEFARHQEISRAGQGKKFGGHGLKLNTGELKAGDEEEMWKVTRLHTATHLLNQALNQVLGDGVEQRGSDITPERTRFDFSFERKVSPEELGEIESIVNAKIREGLPVVRKEMSREEAFKLGARAFFKEKYPERVSVYFIGDPDEGAAFSKEFCGGPHVANTKELGKFKIIKEESSSAGVRRIRAVIEP